MGSAPRWTRSVGSARRHGIPIIEDAAQAIGAEYQGRRTGSLADVACFSFYPTKNLGGFGDGGLLTTRHAPLAEKLRLLRGHGMHPRYHHHVLGINSRLDSLQAAVLNVKLQHLERWTALRRGHAERYGELFAAGELDQVLGLPSRLPNRRHVWNQYVIRVRDGGAMRCANIWPSKKSGPRFIIRFRCICSHASATCKLPSAVYRSRNSRRWKHWHCRFFPR